jgi:hypothetical protein
VAFREALEKVAGGEGARPELVLAKVMLNAKESAQVRVQAATALMPYLHSKMPTALEVGLTDLAPVQIVITGGEQ